MTNKTRSQEIASDIDALLRARNSLLWIVTREEARAERYIFEAALAAAYVPRTWDIAQGVCEMDGRSSILGGQDPGETLTMIGVRSVQENEKQQERGVWIMRDLPVWLAGPPGAAPMRQLRNLARSLPGTPRSTAQAIIVLSPSADVPAELAGHATVIEWPLPDREEIAAILDAAIDNLPEELRSKAAPNGQRDAAIDAAVGLSGEEASACYARSLVQLRRIDAATVAKEKRRVIARERVLEWYDPIPGGLDAVGGLENLKTWLLARGKAYSPDARAYGLPSPKGSLFVGISGCGKTLTAKAIATAWQCPLLRFDFNAMKSKFVGESEANIRRAYKTIEAIGRCVVWIDEVEKAMQGATSGSADGGVSSDALGSFLSWMQERQGEAFVIATANDVSGLPPEFLRKGRFDEVWWIDLPNSKERVSVLQAALRSHGRGTVDIDFAQVAAACDGFTGSEIAAIVPDAMFIAFGENAREITTGDLVKAANTVVPLSKTAEKKIEEMRTWAKGRARPATKFESETTTKTSRSRVLDIA